MARKALTLVEQLDKAYKEGNQKKIDKLKKQIVDELNRSPTMPSDAVLAQDDESYQEPPTRPSTGRTRARKGVLKSPSGVNYEPPSVPPEDSKDESDWLAPIDSNIGRSRQVRMNGEEARLESMQGLRHTNQFAKLRLRADLSPMDQKIEKALQDQPTVPRPGMRGAKRSVARKITMRCEGCLKEYQLYPSEIHVFDADSRFKCDRCIRWGR